MAQLGPIPIDERLVVAEVGRISSLFYLGRRCVTKVLRVKMAGNRGRDSTEREGEMGAKNENG